MLWVTLMVDVNGLLTIAQRPTWYTLMEMSMCNYQLAFDLLFLGSEVRLIGQSMSADWENQKALKLRFNPH